jgi:hypothetical protein
LLPDRDVETHRLLGRVLRILLERRTPGVELHRHHGGIDLHGCSMHVCALNQAGRGSWTATFPATEISSSR